MQHTYTLAALYPYATQMTPGEWAFQAELGYNFKRRTALGGKYGTNVKVNFSHIRAIDQHQPEGELMGTDGFTSHFFKMGNETYYQDVNVQLEKKLTRQFKLNFMYSYQQYNQRVVEGHPHPSGPKGLVVWLARTLCLAQLYVYGERSVQCPRAYAQCRWLCHYGRQDE